MAKRQRSELAAGSFVLIALAAGVGVLIWLGAADVFARRGQTVAFFVPQRRGKLGLEVGSAITVGDDAIGKIRAIHFDPARAGTLYEARLERRDLRVYADARAEAVVEFIGSASIVLETFGTSAAPLADARHPIALTEGANAMVRQAQDALGYGERQRLQFQGTLTKVASAAEDLKEITGKLVEEVNLEQSDALLRTVKDTAGNLQAISKKLLSASTTLNDELDESRADALLKKIKTIAAYVEEVSANAAGLMKTVRPKVEHVVDRVQTYADKDIAAILGDLQTASKGLVEAVGRIRELTAKAENMVVLNRNTIDEILLNLNMMSGNLSAAAKEIRRNPWRLLQKPKDKDVDSQNIYDAARAFAEGAAQLDDALARLTALRTTRPEGVQAGDPELKKILGHLQSTFENFRVAEDSLWKELTR